MKIHKVQLITLVLSILIFSSCDFYMEATKGEGEITSKTLNIDNFSGVNVNFACDVVISQAETQEIKAVGHPNIIEKLKTDVSNDVWTIETEEGRYRDYELTIYIKVPDINKVKISGSSDVLLNEFVNQDDLKLIVSGSGDITLKDFSGKDISIVIDGSGDVKLNTCETTENLSVEINGSGSVKGLSEIPLLNNLSLSIVGSGDFLAFPVKAKKCKISIMGSGNCRVSALDELDIIINGSGDVYYKGNPEVSQTINGSGSVVSSN